MNYRRIPARKPTMMVTAAVIAMLTMVLVAIPVGSDSVKQLVHNFVVASGQSVATGDVVGFLNGYVQKGFVPLQVFNPATTTDISVAKLSSTKFVLAYTDEGNSKKGTAVVADVSGNIVAYGSKYVFNSAWTLEISVAALSSTKFVIVYRDESNSGSSTAVIGDVSGNTITFGSEYVFNSGSTVYISVAALSSTKFVAAYRDYGNSSYGTAIIGDISGTTITYGSESVFNSSNTGWTSVAALTSTRFVVAFSDFSTQLKGITRFGDVSGNTITYGVNFAFNTYDTEYTSVTALSSAKFVVAYKDAGNSDKGTARIGEISGSAILISPAYVFNMVLPT
jgi:uncharacterized membrane protein YciS (DUF1049 family)